MKSTLRSSIFSGFILILCAGLFSQERKDLAHTFSIVARDPSTGEMAERVLEVLKAAQEAGGDIRGKQSAVIIVSIFKIVFTGDENWREMTRRLPASGLLDVSASDMKKILNLDYMYH